MNRPGTEVKATLRFDPDGQVPRDEQLWVAFSAYCAAAGVDPLAVPGVVVTFAEVVDPTVLPPCPFCGGGLGAHAPSCTYAHRG
jgi:hypothetical protein